MLEQPIIPCFEYCPSLSMCHSSLVPIVEGCIIKEVDIAIQVYMARKYPMFAGMTLQSRRQFHAVEGCKGKILIDIGMPDDLVLIGGDEGRTLEEELMHHYGPLVIAEVNTDGYTNLFGSP